MIVDDTVEDILGSSFGAMDGGRILNRLHRRFAALACHKVVFCKHDGEWIDVCTYLPVASTSDKRRAPKGYGWWWRVVFHLGSYGREGNGRIHPRRFRSIPSSSYAASVCSRRIVPWPQIRRAVCHRCIE